MIGKVELVRFQIAPPDRRVTFDAGNGRRITRVVVVALSMGGAGNYQVGLSETATAPASVVATFDAPHPGQNATVYCRDNGADFSAVSLLTDGASFVTSYFEVWTEAKL